MAYEKKEWKDRVAEFAGRRRLINVDTSEELVVDVERDEGLVSQPGDAFSAQNMNDLENRIAKNFGGFSFYQGTLTQAQYDALESNVTEGTVYIVIN